MSSANISEMNNKARLIKVLNKKKKPPACIAMLFILGGHFLCFSSFCLSILLYIPLAMALMALASSSSSRSIYLRCGAVLWLGLELGLGLGLEAGSFFIILVNS